MANYYDELVRNIKSLIEKNDFLGAKKLIDEELAIPYTPASVLQQIQKYQSIVETNLKTKTKITFKSENEMYEDLISGSERAMSALDALAKSNCRIYLNMIKDLLKGDEINHILKCLICEVLIEQRIDDEIEFKKEGDILVLNPTKMNCVFKKESFNNICQLIEIRTIKNPSFTKQCIMVLSNVLYDIFPDDIADNEYQLYCDSVIKYVFRAYDNESDWEKFKKRYDIDENILIDFNF